jgi:hypothetical protein
MIMDISMKIHSLLTGFEIAEMSRYLDLVQSAIDQRLIEIEDSYKDALSEDLSEDELYLLDDHYTDKFLEAGSKFPQFLFSNFVFSWYSFVEQKLLNICTNIRKELSINLGDFKSYGKGIRRARKFLLQEKEYEIHQPYWEELVHIGRLRNHIIHNGNRLIGSYLESEEGMIQLKDDDGVSFFFLIDNTLFDYIKANNLYDHSGIFLDISPTNEYCNHLIKFAHKFLNKIYIDLSSKSE